MGNFQAKPLRKKRRKNESCYLAQRLHPKDEGHMPFNNFDGEVTEPDELHVFQSPGLCPGYWRCRGRSGDYGLAKTREEAIKIALDTKVTGMRNARIYVHEGFGKLRNSRFIITRVRGLKPSAQFFQDDVP